MNQFELWVHEDDPDAEPELVESFRDRELAIDAARAIVRLGDPVTVWELEQGGFVRTLVFDSKTDAA